MMTITKRKVRGAQRLVELLPLLRDDKDDDNDADGGGIIVGTLCLFLLYSIVREEREATSFALGLWLEPGYGLPASGIGPLNDPLPLPIRYGTCLK